MVSPETLCINLNGSYKKIDKLMLSNPFIQNDLKKMIENEEYEENALMQRKSYVKSEEELAK